jgi:hypothetical protein
MKGNVFEENTPVVVQTRRTGVHRRSTGSREAVV